MIIIMEQKRKGITLPVQAGAIAAIYVVLSLLTYQFSYLEIQCRVAESMCMLIFFTPAASWGVVIGCFLTNMFGGSIIDMIFGTLATLIAVLLTIPITKAIKKKCSAFMSRSVRRDPPSRK